ncbi:Taurine catabolism dioxygenase TauD, TfdA family [Thalassoglobus neptunius]|uniref:Taurine catabolism dioxygenase TauD, TfdA family n=1 Tax=Thalassoglobus neptunius TaxID=1938619 RepID=A0A5C5WYV2_9PLAN|nr:Taurine catabolism dioxygenase TauD, TfdA family [Thalassoglobus neptunius]
MIEFLGTSFVHVFRALMDVFAVLSGESSVSQLTISEVLKNEESVREVHVDGQLSIDGGVFPIVIQWDSPSRDLADVEEFLKPHSQLISDTAAKHGAILFRGFPVADAFEFDRFIEACGFPNFRYEDSLSNAVRVVKTDRVFTANEAPPEVTIFLHHEMAQTPVYPSKLFFFCEHAADTGGATPLCRSDALFELMQKELPEFAADCENKGLQYTNVMPGFDDAQSGMGRSWQSTFRAQTREEAEERMRELGYTWTWLDDGSLKAVTPVLDAVRDLGDGRKAFFNQLIAAYKGWKDTRNDPSNSIRFGDGSILDPEDVMACSDLAERVTFDLMWQSGDIALVDNYVAMHGRRNFTGTRKVLASLVAGESVG